MCENSEYFILIPSIIRQKGEFHLLFSKDIVILTFD